MRAYGSLRQSVLMLKNEGYLAISFCRILIEFYVIMMIEFFYNKYEYLGKLSTMHFTLIVVEVRSESTNGCRIVANEATYWKIDNTRIIANMCARHP